MKEAISKIESLCRRYSITLPDDFERYLLEEASIEERWDAHGIIWWNLDRIRSLTDECLKPPSPQQRSPEIEAESGKYLVFADYLMWCYAYAICCSDGPNRGKVALIGVEPDGFVADSFSQFAVLAAENSFLLHSPAGDLYRRNYSAT